MNNNNYNYNNYNYNNNNYNYNFINNYYPNINLQNSNNLYFNIKNNNPSYNNYINNDTNIDNNLMKFEDVSRNPLFINLLHYDENLTNNENQNYYKYFKLNVVGGYYGIDLFDMFTEYIEAINKSKIFLRYILIISGSDSIKVLNYCYNYKYIDEIIIFCYMQNKYDYLLSFPKIKLVTTSFNDVILYLKNKKKSYSDEELDMSNQIPTTPLITFYEYERCYFAIHRMIAKFFGDYNYWPDPKINPYDVQCVNKFLKRSNFDDNLKIKISNIMKSLCVSKNFTLDCIKYYTGENLCYLFNKTLRDIGKNYDGMSHFVGPFDYALFYYLMCYPSKGLRKNINLYRDVTMPNFDLYLYYLSLNDVICLPSFTSTTFSKDLNFESTDSSKIINNCKPTDIHVKMIFSYKYEKGNISPGIFIKDESVYSGEEEVILFPFTMVKITRLKVIDNKNVNIYFDIINKNRIIEIELKKKARFYLDKVNNKIIFDRDLLK